MSKSPLALICLDAGDPERILTWARSGLLPTMASILERGTHGRLSGPEMISIHGVWMTFFSGVSLSKHGRYLPRTLEPGTYQLKKIEVNPPPFWTDFRNGDQKVLIVDAPDMQPIPDVAGYQLANWGTHFTDIPPSSLPEKFLAELPSDLSSRIKTDERIISPTKDRTILKQILQRVEKKGELCRYLLNKEAFDLVVVGFGDCHAASHRFEKYTNTASELEKAVFDVYQAVDRETGQILKSFPQNANCFIISDSGIREGYPIFSVMNSFLCELGYQVLFEPRIVRNFLRFGQERFFPLSWKYRMLEKQFGKRVDWSKTTAFAIPGYYTGYVRINLKGREPNGIVSPGSEYESLLDQLESDFRKLIDEKTSEPVVERISRTAELFGGGAPLGLPDLFIDWRIYDQPTRTILHPQIKIVQKENRHSRGNYHSSTGLIMGAGPAIARSGPAGDFSPLNFVSLFRSVLNDSGERFAADFPLAAFVAKK